MAIIYADSREGPMVPHSALMRMDAVAKWGEHFSNSIMLTRIISQPHDPGEKRQAMRELEICQRKMEWWRRHPRFCQQQAANLGRTIQQMWSDPQNASRAMRRTGR